MMKTVQRILMGYVIGLLALSLLTAVLYETDVLETGLFVPFQQAAFITTTVMELLTLAGVFFGLRLFKFKRVLEDLADRMWDGLMAWGTLRIFLIGLPMLLNTTFYYWFVSPTFGYMALIGLLCLPFIWPSMARCKAEIDDAFDEEDPA